MRASFFGRIREPGGVGADLRHVGGNSQREDENMRQDGADLRQDGVDFRQEFLAGRNCKLMTMTKRL